MLFMLPASFWSQLPGLVSLAIAAATLVVVLVQERRFRRRVGPAAWSTTLIGTRQVPELDRLLWIVKIEQNGSHMVQLLGLWTFDASISADNEYRIKSRVFRPGDTLELLFDSEDIDKGWLMLTWVSLEDRFQGGTEWIPLSITSPLAETLWEQQRQEAAIPRWKQSPHIDSYMLRRVGPTHSLYRRTPTSLKAQKRLAKMAQEVLLEDIRDSTGAAR